MKPTRPPPPSRRAQRDIPVEARPAARPPRAPAAAPEFDEVKIHGVNACKALFLARPGEIIRVYLTEDMIKPMGRVLAWCATQKKTYHVIPDDELAKVAGGMHHEGVCILARQRPAVTLEQLLAPLAGQDRPVALVALEDVQNPHNVGAILRVAAHFGVPAVLCLGATPSRLSSAAYRTAEGGAEHVHLVAVPDAAAGVAALRQAGFQVLATSHRGDVPLYGAALPRRLVVMFGSEASGLTAPTFALAEGALQVAGTGSVESLNVACASSAVLGEFWRQHPLH